MCPGILIDVLIEEQKMTEKLLNFNTKNTIIGIVCGFTIGYLWHKNSILKKEVKQK